MCEQSLLFSLNIFIFYGSFNTGSAGQYKPGLWIFNICRTPGSLPQKLIIQIFRRCLHGIHRRLIPVFICSLNCAEVSLCTFVLISRVIEPPKKITVGFKGLIVILKFQYYSLSDISLNFTLLTNSMERSPPKLVVVAQVFNSPRSEGSLPFSQKPAAVPILSNINPVRTFTSHPCYYFPTYA